MDSETLTRARRHLSRRDAILKPLIRKLGPCTLQHNPNHFEILVRSIISQQISTKAARAIAKRFRTRVGRFLPKNIIAATDDDMREAGLSRGKQKSLRDLAQKCSDGTVPLKKLAALEDAEVIEALIQVHGIGVWTAEMFLIFSLGRLDVMPVGDYGLRAGLLKHYELDELPKKDVIHELTASWRPYRSIGTWYIWRSLGGVPQSD